MLFYVGLGFEALTLVAAIGTWIWNRYQLSQTKKKIAARQVKSRDRRRTVEEKLRNTSSEEFDPNITEMSFSELQERLQSGQLTARKVLFAYQHKALSIDNDLNCVADFIENAEERATYLDSIAPEDRKSLHGIPISLKDSVGVEGMDATCGVGHFIDDDFTADGLLLQVLKDQGAVPFVKTNVSQAQAGFACSNPIFGTTKNPFDPTRTPGGSCGGEGALIGAGGSILGVACDFGGSIRIPCHFCGICGLKPSDLRLSGAGNYKLHTGVKTYCDVYGCMGRDVDSLVAMMKASLTPKMYELDPMLPKMPWREEIYTNRVTMKIGYYCYDGGLEPVPAVKRAMIEAKEALCRMGHEVIEYRPRDVSRAVQELFVTVLLGDGGKLAKELMKHDVVEPFLKYLFKLMVIPYTGRRLLARVVKVLKKTHPMEDIVVNVKLPKTVGNWWTLNEKIEDYRREFMRDMREFGVDMLLSPAYPFTAFFIDDESCAAAGATYPCLNNILNLPCGVLPVTTVNALDLKSMDEYPKGTNAEKYVHKVSTGSEGFPVAVQLAAFPFQEETVLRVMKDLEDGLKSP